MTAKAIRGSFRTWMFTINNPIVNDLPDRFTNNCEFITWQLEIGEKGTPHLQGYLVLKSNPKNKNGRTKKWLLDTLAPMGVYFEPRNGSHEQAVHYCNKPIENCKCKHCEPKPVRLAGPWTFGQWSETEGQQRGGRAAGAVHKRTVEDLLDDIKGGSTDRQVLDKYPRLAMTMTKGIERARLILSQDEARVQPYCVVFYGPTGTGKSHRAAEISKNNGGGFTFRKGNAGNMWADGYDPIRHPVVTFEEMDGSFMPYRQLLRICDKWQLVLDTKGGAVNFCPKIIIFTANKHPKEWYSEETVKDTTELMRRLSGAYGAIIEMKTPFVQPQLDEPDLADIIDLLETGDLVDKVTKIVDLTDETDISDDGKSPRPLTPESAWDDGAYDADEVDEGAYDHHEPDDLDDVDAPDRELVEAILYKDARRGGFYDERTPVQRMPPLHGYQPPAPKPLVRSDTSTLGLERVIDTRIGTEKVQSKIALKRPRQLNADDDDDHDDK